jgi:hypothetical protein
MSLPVQEKKPILQSSGSESLKSNVVKKRKNSLMDFSLAKVPSLKVFLSQFLKMSKEPLCVSSEEART